MTVHTWNQGSGWHSETMPLGTTVNGISVSEDGMWLAGALGGGRTALWLKERASGRLVEREVHLRLLQRARLCLERSVEELHAVCAESRPRVVRADPPDLFDRPFCHLLIEGPAGTWTAHKLPFGVELVAIPRGMVVVTADGGVQRVGEDARLVSQAPAASLRSTMRATSPGVNGDIRVHRADAIDERNLAAPAGVYDGDVCLAGIVCVFDASPFLVNLCRRAARVILTHAVRGLSTDGHRIRELTYHAGDLGVAHHLGIPRSTVASWMRRGFRDAITLDPFEHSWLVLNLLESFAAVERLVTSLASSSTTP